MVDLSRIYRSNIYTRTLWELPPGPSGGFSFSRVGARVYIQLKIEMNSSTERHPQLPASFLKSFRFGLTPGAPRMVGRRDGHSLDSKTVQRSAVRVLISLRFNKCSNIHLLFRLFFSFSKFFKKLLKVSVGDNWQKKIF